MQFTILRCETTDEDALRCKVYFDQLSMERAQLQFADVVQISVGCKNVLARIGPAFQVNVEKDVIRIPQFMLEALEAKELQQATVAKVKAQALAGVALYSDMDWSLAAERQRRAVIEHLQNVLSHHQTLLFSGAVFYVRNPEGRAGSVYRVREISAPGEVTKETQIELLYDEKGQKQSRVTFADVGGLNAEIALLREMVQLPLQFPQVYRRLGIQPPKGILLYGPPGTGKTHLTRALAGEIQAKLYYINGPDIIGTNRGETEAVLRKLFSEAAYNAPSIIFIDELDSIAPYRGETGNQSDTRTVTQLLSLLDGMLKTEGVIVVGTTNRIDAIDMALRRPGRFDREIFVGPPNPQGRKEILRIHTNRMPLDDSAAACLDDVAQKTHGYVGADLLELCREAGLSAWRRAVKKKEDSSFIGIFSEPLEQLQVTAQDFETALQCTRPSAIREAVACVPKTSWADIAGLDDIKRQLQLKIGLALRQPEKLHALGLKQVTGFVLHGPSGTGKTMLAHAVAHEAGINFISIEGSEIFNKWLGESEQSLRHYFRMASALSPCILLIEQLDALARNRGEDGGSRATERVVSTLLSELDALQQRKEVFVIATTNRLDLIDPAVLRPGRLGCHMMVSLPAEPARKEILQKLLQPSCFEKGTDVEQLIDDLVSSTDGWSGAQLSALYEDAVYRFAGEESATGLLNRYYFELFLQKEPNDKKICLSRRS